MRGFTFIEDLLVCFIGKRKKAGGSGFAVRCDDRMLLLEGIIKHLAALRDLLGLFLIKRPAEQDLEHCDIERSSQMLFHGVIDAVDFIGSCLRILRKTELCE